MYGSILPIVITYAHAIAVHNQLPACSGHVYCFWCFTGRALRSEVEPVSSVCLCNINILADLTVSKRPGTSYRIEIHFIVFNRLYLLVFFIKLVET